MPATVSGQGIFESGIRRNPRYVERVTRRPVERSRCPVDAAACVTDAKFVEGIVGEDVHVVAHKGLRSRVRQAQDTARNIAAAFR